MDRLEKNERQKLYRILTNNNCTKKYEKTKKGFLVRLYRNMKSRVDGIQKTKHHLYAGKFLLDKSDFYEWAINQQKFHELFLEWENAGYERRLCPSVDRIDSSLGYETSNMEFVPFHENCRRGLYSKLKKLYSKSQNGT